MATTTLGQTNTNVTGSGMNKDRTNRTIYWMIGATLAIILLFAFFSTRNDSALTPAGQNLNSVTPANNAPENFNYGGAPSMDSSVPTNSAVPLDQGTSPNASPNSDVFTNPPVNPDVKRPSDPGTTKSVDSPKGTVERQ